MTSGIYYIKNILNGKYYIGQSVNVKKRQYRHFNDLSNNKHNNKHLQNAYNKYGPNAFEFRLIKACKPRYLNRLEKLYIKQYNAYEQGYNLIPGGSKLIKENNPFYNKTHDIQSCISMSKNKNKTGYFRVYYDTNRYKYRWYEDGKRKSISSVNIDELKEKVQAKGLVWQRLY